MSSSLYLPIPTSILTKLQLSGNTFVAYSAMSSMNVNEIKKKLNISANSEMSIRIDSKLIDGTILGNKYGNGFRDYHNPDCYGLCRDYHDISIKIMKLPIVLRY